MRWVVVLAACGSAPLPMPPDPTPAEETIPMSEAGVGKLTVATQANLVELRKLLVGYEVVPVNLVIEPSPELPALEFQVFDRGKRLFEIVPTETGAIMNVHVDSPRVAIAGRPWRVGAPFAGTVTKCECWGGTPVCFKEGERIGVSFKRSCTGLAGKPRVPVAVIEGKPIERLVWSPKPLGTTVDSDVDVPLFDDVGP